MPVLQKNHRKIVSFELKDGTKAVMAIVGATCVGTIEIDFKKNSIIKKGDDIGTFKFGGSCLVLLLDKPCKYNSYLQTRSKKHLETYLTVGKPIANFV
jgi:phosphatidylserine decarboxylase